MDVYGMRIGFRIVAPDIVHKLLTSEYLSGIGRGGKRTVAQHSGIGAAGIYLYGIDGTGVTQVVMGSTVAGQHTACGEAW